MREILEEKLARFQELERQMMDPDIASNSGRVAAVAREHGSLAKLATKYRAFKRISDEIAELKQMAKSDDPDERDLAKAELPAAIARREEVWNELLDLTIGGEDANRTRCVMEIRAGTGGDEAALFARDLYEMYKHYAEAAAGRSRCSDVSPTELGGFKEVIIGARGRRRLPRAAVRERRPSRAARAGDRSQGPHPHLGRHRGRHGRARRRGNRPQAGRLSQGHLPRQRPRRPARQQDGLGHPPDALRNGHRRVDARTRRASTRTSPRPSACSRHGSTRPSSKQEHEKRASERKTKIGSGDRSQRIRTYNFPENRLTDHRINLTLYKLDQILAGALAPITEALVAYDRDQLRGSMKSDLN